MTREELLAKALEKIIEFDTDVSDGGKVHDHGIFAEIAIEALRHPVQRMPSRKQIEAVIDDYLGNIDATYEDSRQRCAQRIVDLCAFSSTSSVTPPKPDDICAGGINPGWDECPKCGATMDDPCAFAPAER